MSATIQRSAAVVVRLAMAVLATTAWAGCDMGLDQPSNRYERLNQEMKVLVGELKQVTDEATANEHRAAIEAAVAKILEVQKGIIGAEADNDKKGMARITNHRQATMWMQIADSARRQVEWIRETDIKAGAIVDKAIEGVIFPENSGL